MQTQGDKPKDSVQPTTVAPSESVSDIVNVIADRVDPLLEYLKMFTDRSLQLQSARATYHIKMTWSALVFLILILLGAGLLTYVDKVDGSTFTFLLGLVVGYVLTFVRDAIQPSDDN